MIRKWIFPTILVILAAAVCVRLGIWQLDRLAQRRAFNQHYMTMASAPPVNLSEGEDLQQMEYRQVIAQGRFDFSQQVALRNQYYHDQYGYHLLTPLVLGDGTAILVDRGWIPSEGNLERSGWDQYDENGLVTVNGIVRLSREKGDLIGNPDPELAPGQTRLDIWNFPNVPRIQNQVSYKLNPVYIQETRPDEDSSLPVSVQPEVDLTEGPHMGYALQWFTFAAIFLIGYPFYVSKQFQKKGKGNEIHS